MRFGYQFNIKLKNQILFGFMFLMILIVFLVAIMFYTLKSLDKSSEQILKENYISIEAGQVMERTMERINEIHLATLFHSDSADMNSELPKLQKIFLDNFFISDNNITEIGEKEILAEIRLGFNAYHSVYDSVGTTNLTESNYLNILLPEILRVERRVNSLIELNHSASLAKNEESRKDFNLAWIYLLLISFFTIVIAITVIIKIPTAILKPLNLLTNEISKISDGNYGRVIKFSSKNELGTLIKSFNNMSVKLAEYKQSNMEIIIGQKSRIESIVNSLNDAIIVLDENTNIVLANPKALELLGIKFENLINKNASEVATYNGLLRELLGLIDSGTIEGKDIYLRISVNGREEFYTKEIIQVKDILEAESEKYFGHVIVLKNVTEFKELDDKKSTFIATLSHEVKTPLSAMNMSLNLLLNNKVGKINAEQEEIVISIKNEIQRLLSIITDLLDLSKFETGHIKIHFQKVDAKFILNYSLSPFYNSIKEKAINLKINIQESLPEFRADPEKISWVLMNLIGNAIRYTSGNQSIIINVDIYEKYIRFCVSDSGPGIEEKYLKKIFEKYFQVPGKEYMDHEGLGLGLAICKEIVHSHRGKIWATSELGEGSSFYFTLPIL